MRNLGIIFVVLSSIGLPTLTSAQEPPEKLTQEGIYKLSEALGELHEIGIEIEALNRSNGEPRWSTSSRTVGR